MEDDVIVRVLDSSGRVIGEVRNHTLFGLDGKEICEVKPTTKMSYIVEILLSKVTGYVV